ncbi:MAG: hypothetical protein P0Y59_12530 [Candidatus Sphingomonas phytovorans]|nr:hypothetical protein [Sphingomonas sp.]WEJ97795.1 MAG: hypothetical protein P0Y59_12530 [Sphingomonas sp.]
MEDDPFTSAARERFGQELFALRQLAKAARQMVAKLSRGNETRLLATAREGLANAEHHSTTAIESLAEGGHGEAIAAYLSLHEALGDSVLSIDFIVEFDSQLDEVSGKSAQPKLQRLWADLESQFDTIKASTGSLAEAARDFSHSIDAKETGTMEPEDNATAVAVEELGITLATMISEGGGSVARGRSSGAFATVTDQMAASLNTAGFPTLGDTGTVEVKRQRLIDALRNNFAFREQDGYRVYYRTDRRTVTRGASGDSDLLRGGQRVNADLLQAESDAVEDIIGRLPVTTRFELARGAEAGPPRERAAIRDELNGLVASARDPMGINAARATFQFHRLVLAILEYLQEGEALPKARTFSLVPGDGIERIIAWLSTFRDEEVCAPTSLVEDEELRAELANLLELLASMGGRLIRDPHRYRLGLYAARLEAQLTCALTSVDLLEAALEQSGTDMDEQEVQFLSHGKGTRTQLSIGQFLRWVDSVARPFAQAGNRAAELRQSEAVLLALELAALAEAANCFKHAARSMGIARLGAHQQLVELTGYLTAAADNAGELGGNPRAHYSATA